MLSDVAGPKVHFGVLPQQRPRDGGGIMGEVRLIERNFGIYTG